MDYGVYLKEKHGNPSRKSLHYKKQPPLAGSVRQARARLVRFLVASPGAHRAQLLASLPAKRRFLPALSGLMKDGMVRESRGRYWIA
jgi:A/G-specific adenine glycosylase